MSHCLAKLNVGESITCNDVVSSRADGGFTLIEALICVFISSIGILMWVTNEDGFIAANKANQALSTSSNVGSLIRLNATQYSALTQSVASGVNPELASCLTGIGTGTGTTTCSSLKTTEFNLYSAMPAVQYDTNGNMILDSNNKPILASSLLAGTSAIVCSPGAKSSVFYTATGQPCPCNAPAAACPFQAVSTFTPMCPNQTATCTTASSIMVNYTVKPRSDLGQNSAVPAWVQDAGTYTIYNQSKTSLWVNFAFAQSNLVNGGSGSTAIGSLSQFDIEQGKALSYVWPSTLATNVAFQSPSLVSRVDIKLYWYNPNCNLLNIGTTISVNGSSVSCLPPTTDSAFTTVTQSQPNLAIPTNSATVALSDIPLTFCYLCLYEAKAVISDSSGNVLAETPQDLLVSYTPPPSLKITPPGPAGNPEIMYVCNPASTYNTFGFTASATGWQSTNATLTSAAGVTIPFPGFTAYNPNNPNTQNFILNPNTLVEGAHYTLSFQGTTIGGTLVTAPPVTFLVKPHPAKTIHLNTPTANSLVQTLSSLAISAKMNIACTDTPHSVTFTVTDPNNNALLPADDVTSTCTSILGSPDQNQYSCSRTYPCSQWLGLSSSSACATVYSSNTQLTATGAFVDLSGQIYTNSVNFFASSQVSASISPNYVQWVLFNTPGPSPISLTGSAPVPIVFASPLLSGQTASFQLTGSSGTYSFTCTSSSSCQGSIPTPPSGDVFTLRSLSPNVIVGMPNTVTFVYVDDSVLGCGNSGLVCPSGQQLIRQLNTIGNYYYGYGSSSSAWALPSYSLLGNPASTTLDFFISYLPSTTTGPSLSLQFNITLAANTFYVGNIDGSSSNACGGTPQTCPGNYLNIPPSVTAPYLSQMATAPFQLQGQNGFSINQTGLTPGIVVIRQCYCH